MERLVEQRRVIMDILLDPKKNDSTLLLKDHEWEMLSDMSNVLKDFSAVTTYMCSDRYVSVSQIYPNICRLLRKSLVINEADRTAVRRTKDSIREELNRRYKPSAKSIPELASFLGPRYKRLTFLSFDQKKKRKRN